MTSLAPSMTVWVDADACPRPLKELLIRASERRKLRVIFVANHTVSLPMSPLLGAIEVKRGEDVADTYIVEHAQGYDLVITQDVPLAARLVPNGVAVMNLRGFAYDANNIQERLSVRDMLTEARDLGIQTGGPPPFGDKQKQAFAQTFDKLIAKQQRALNMAKAKAAREAQGERSG